MASEMKNVIEALEKGEYEVSYEEPNCFEECTRKDGSVYYVVRGDDAQFGCSNGSTTVTCLGYDFVFDFTEQYWEGVDDVECDEEAEEDVQDLIDALDNLPVERLSDCPDMDELVAFYETATGKSGIEAYYYEDEDCPDEDEEEDGEEEDEDV